MELPGFQIETEIGRGGMARVYRAVQKKFGRLVALKVVSADYAKDAQFRKRFLQESRINGQLSHPNIVQVYDVGAFEDFLYLVMEYVPGGDLNRRLERGMHIQDLINVVRDIGRALDYAHQKGFIHRDIKPENILFRDDGSAVLTDFGIARFVDPRPSLTRAGTVVGTPQYMSPEQASGKELDGRSDLYSLGVVFYRMLTGDVPYKADSAVAVGVKHLQESIPRLPNYLKPFQEVIDRCLAKKPEHRYQSGVELAEALDAVRHNGNLPNATVKTQAVTTQEIRAVGSTLITATRDPARHDRPSRRRRRNPWLRAALPALLLLAVLGSGTWLFTQKPEWVSQIAAFVGITETPAVANAWNAARSLHDDPNQSLAAIVAGYQRVLNLAPGHEGAADAIAGLASQWKRDIESAIEQGNLDLARTKLAESEAAFPQDPTLAALRETLDNRTHAQRLLASTQALLQSHGLSDIPSATAAIQAYQEVLRLHPGNAAAQAELNQLAEHYTGLAREAAERGDADSAINFLDRASAANPSLPELAGVRDLIQQATSTQGAIDELLQQASTYRASGALIDPPGQNAAELYHRVLAIAPDNVIATQGLNEVMSQLSSVASSLIGQGELDEVMRIIDRASAVGFDATGVQNLRDRVTSERQKRGRVSQLLSQAENRMEEGFLTEPPEVNAVALLREVQRLDPGNEAAAGLLAQVAERLAMVAKEAFDAGFVADARQYLDLALTVTPDVPEWRALREAWKPEG